MVVIVVIQSFYFIYQQIEQVVTAKVSKHAKRASKERVNLFIMRILLIILRTFALLKYKKDFIYTNI